MLHQSRTVLELDLSQNLFPMICYEMRKAGVHDHTISRTSRLRTGLVRVSQYKYSVLTKKVILLVEQDGYCANVPDRVKTPSFFCKSLLKVLRADLAR